jgi:hypothetical protein
LSLLGSALQPAAWGDSGRARGDALQALERVTKLV